jgi:hypothetical protein
MSFESSSSVEATVNDSGGAFRAPSRAFNFTYVWGEINTNNGRTGAGIIAFAANPPE